MAMLLHDTQFGRGVRLVSSRRLFRYADEVDPTIGRLSFGPDSRSKGTAENPRRPGVPQDTSRSEGRTWQHPKESSEMHDLKAEPANDDEMNYYLVGWYGPDDPENPRNWPSSWKLFICFEICVWNFAVYIGSSIYTPGEQEIMEDFGVSEVVATLGLSLFTAGYGLGPMLWSPMSEIPRLGRLNIYFWTFLVFVLLQLPSGFAVNMGMLLAFRLLAGFFGSPCLATGGATIQDIYDPGSATYAVCIWGSFGLLGPVFGPIVGGFVAPAMGWRWTIWVLAWFNALILILMFFFLPETSSANILMRRAERLRLTTGDNRFRSLSEIHAAHHTIKDHLLILGTAFKLTFTEPIVLAMDLYTALLYGLVFLWFESFPLVFGNIYHFNLSQQGLAFLGIFTGALITLPLYLAWVRIGVIPKFSSPMFVPEALLPPTFFGSITLPICLFWYGWSSRETIHWIVPIVGSGVFSVSVITLFFPVLNYLGVSYPHSAASVFAGNTLFRASFGAIFPLFARQLFRQLGIGGGNSLLAGISICFIPIPHLLYRYGPKIRHMSKNARHDV